LNTLLHLVRPLFLCLLVLGLAGAGEAPQPTVITSDRFEMKGTDTETASNFDGHVVVTATGMRLECDHLEVISARMGDKEDTVGQQDRFRSLIATGNVRIVQGDREATCGRAEVLPREDRITLTLNPVVIDRGNNTRAEGEEIYMLRNERQVRGKNIRITAPPLRDLGFDAKQTPPAADKKSK
jgi:lipopolysaccharide export system protein LptA